MEPLEIVYQDRRVLVAVKPYGVRSTDEPGGMPELLRRQLGDPQACVKTVHRLDQVVGGLMLFARSRMAAKLLSGQVAQQQMEKRYLAVVHGTLPEPYGTFRDLLTRDPASRRTLVAEAPGRDVRPAELSYCVLDCRDGRSLVEITLKTGRTHQIRVQFASRGFPLVGDRKYGRNAEEGPIALWSCMLRFTHPERGDAMTFTRWPEPSGPWRSFLPCEVLDVVDDAGVLTGRRVSRRLAHQEGIPHRTSHVWLVRCREGRLQVLLQKRSADKDSYPGCYDISSAGHIPAGVDFIPSALRELREELGVEARPEELVLCGQRKFSFDREFHGQPFRDRQVSNVYLLWRDQTQFQIQREELSEVRWFDLEECMALVRSNGFPHCIYPEELEMVRRTALHPSGKTGLGQDSFGL